MPATTYDFLATLNEPTPDELASVTAPDDFDMWALYYDESIIDE